MKQIPSIHGYVVCKSYKTTFGLQLSKAGDELISIWNVNEMNANPEVPFMGNE